ncbi:MAG TPA: hypothetical protein VKD72_18640 [Gemmataceae bacterium]|nr:hypothetical protein [Gemmataceae bacterium]
MSRLVTDWLRPEPIRRAVLALVATSRSLNDDRRSAVAPATLVRARWRSSAPTATYTASLGFKLLWDRHNPRRCN